MNGWVLKILYLKSFSKFVLCILGHFPNAKQNAFSAEPGSLSPTSHSALPRSLPHSPSHFLLVIPCFLIWIFKYFDEQSKLLNLRGSCSSNKGWECLLQNSSNHISFQAMSLLSLSFGYMKFPDFLADEIFCHRRSWWFLFFCFPLIPM